MVKEKQRIMLKFSVVIGFYKYRMFYSETKLNLHGIG